MDKHHHKDNEDESIQNNKLDSMDVIDLIENDIGFIGALRLLLSDMKFHLSISSNPIIIMDWIRLGFRKISPEDTKSVIMIIDASNFAICHYIKYNDTSDNGNNNIQLQSSIKELTKVALTSVYIQLTRAQEELELKKITTERNNTNNRRKRGYYDNKLIESCLSLFTNICYNIIYNNNEVLVEAVLVTYDIHKLLEKIMNTIINGINDYINYEYNNNGDTVYDDEYYYHKIYYSAAVSAYTMIEPRQYESDISKIITNKKWLTTIIEDDNDNNNSKLLLQYLYPCYNMLATINWGNNNDCIISLLNIATNNNIDYLTRDEANILLSKVSLSDNIFIPDLIPLYDDKEQQQQYNNNNITNIADKNDKEDNDKSILISSCCEHEDGSSSSSSRIDNMLLMINRYYYYYSIVDKDTCSNIIKWVLKLIECKSYVAAAGFIIRIDMLVTITDDIIDNISSGIVHSLIKHVKAYNKLLSNNDNDGGGDGGYYYNNEVTLSEQDKELLLIFNGIETHLKCIGILIKEKRFKLKLNDKHLLIQLLTKSSQFNTYMTTFGDDNILLQLDRCEDVDNNNITINELVKWIIKPLLT